MPGLSYSSVSYDYLKFSGKELDEEEGLYKYHFGWRDYDPAIGRWFVVDPARQFASPYVFNGNNAVCHFDEDGQFVIALALAGLASVIIDVGIEYVASKSFDAEFQYNFWDGLKSFTQGFCTGGLSYLTKTAKVGSFLYKLGSKTDLGWTLLRSLSYTTINTSIDIGVDIGLKKEKFDLTSEGLNFGAQLLMNTGVEKFISNTGWDDPFKELTTFQKKKLNQVSKAGLVDLNEMEAFNFAAEFSFEYSKLVDHLPAHKVRVVERFSHIIKRNAIYRSITYKLLGKGTQLFNTHNEFNKSEEVQLVPVPGYENFYYAPIRNKD